MAGTKINEATLRESLKGTENIPIVDTDLPKGRTTLANLKEYVKPESITVDSELNTESTNPVQNKVIAGKVKEMQEDVDLLLAAGFGLWYGVEWDVTESDSSVTRIGNMDLHRSLPIQSGMYRCILNDDGEEVYKLGADDSTKKEDGATAAVLDGTDGMVMVRIPTFYAKFVRDGNKRRVLISENNLPGFMRMGGCYISAYEATIDRTTSGTPKLASVVNETANFRGGNNNAEWDGSYRSLLGMPATVTSLTNFRTYARNRKADNTEWNCMDYHAYKALYWLYVVEYVQRLLSLHQVWLHQQPRKQDRHSSLYHAGRIRCGNTTNHLRTILPWCGESVRAYLEVDGRPAYPHTVRRSGRAFYPVYIRQPGQLSGFKL